MPRMNDDNSPANCPVAARSLPPWIPRVENSRFPQFSVRHDDDDSCQGNRRNSANTVQASAVVAIPRGSGPSTNRIHPSPQDQLKTGESSKCLAQSGICQGPCSFTLGYGNPSGSRPQGWQGILASRRCGVNDRRSLPHLRTSFQFQAQALPRRGQKADTPFSERQSRRGRAWHTAAPIGDRSSESSTRDEPDHLYRMIPTASRGPRFASCEVVAVSYGGGANGRIECGGER